MAKYPYAVNLQKLQRAIEKVRVEQHTGKKREDRIRELYVSYGGKVALPELNEDEIMEEEIKEPTNDPINNEEANNPTEESGPDLGGQGSTDDVPFG